MTVDSSNLYWIQDYIGGGTGCSLSQMALDGGATTTLATASDPLVAIALNTTTVFFTTQNTTDTIWGVPIGGGASPVALVTGQKYLSALAADDNHLYWGTQPNGDGELFQATVTGASITQLATSPQSTIESIVVDTTTICFASAFAAMGYPPDANPPVDGIFSTPIGGGPITYLGPTGFPLLLDSTTLYFGQKNALAKMAKDGGAQVTLTRDPSILSYRAALGPTYVYAPASQNQGGSVLATPR
jgi:hypothetical protein